MTFRCSNIDKTLLSNTLSHTLVMCDSIVITFLKTSTIRDKNLKFSSYIRVTILSDTDCRLTACLSQLHVLNTDGVMCGC